MDKKIFIKNRPFDVNDANEMQTWTEDALKKTMASIYSSGIVSGLAVTVNSNLKVNIGAGTAFDSNYDFINLLAATTLTLDAANTNPRIDKVVIKYQSSTVNNVDTGNIYGLGTSLVYSQNKKDGYVISFVKGTPAASPVAPATPAGSLLLAEVTVPANATSLVSGNIVDRRAYISINNNIITPEVVFSGTAPGNTNVLWIDTTNSLPKIYKNSAWTTLSANDATTLDGNDSSAFALANHNHDTAYYTKSLTYSKVESDNAYTKKANNLSDLANAATARTNLGLGSAATSNTSAFAPAIHNHDGIYTKGDYVLAISGTAPTADAKAFWWDTTNNLIKRWNGTAWVSLNASDAATLGGASKGTSANNILQLDSSGKVPIANISAASTSVAGTMSAADKLKLDGIATNANNYSHPTGDGNSHVPATGTGNNTKVLKAGSTANSAAWGVVNGSEVAEDATHRFVTDTEKTTWNGKASTSVATTGANGLMSSTDKSKLDNIAANAEVNQNAFTSVIGKTGGTFNTVTASSKTDTFTIEGQGLIQVTTNVSTDTVILNTTAEVNQNAFSQVNVNGALVTADNKTDQLNVFPGNGISVVADSPNNKMTISLDETAWLTLTLKTGITVYSTGSELKYKKIGNQVFIRGVVKGIAANGTAVATLPASTLYPGGMVHSFAMPTSADGSGNARFARWAISNTTGDIILESMSGGPPAATYWFPIMTSFFID